MIAHLKNWIKALYDKVLSVNDSPQKKALGLGVGVFLGNFPGVGTVTALVCAYILRINQAMALLGSVLTNTWLSLVTLIFSVKLGSFMRGKDWYKVKSDWDVLIADFNWENINHPTVLDTLCSIFLGYFLISLILGGLVYLVALIFFHHRARLVSKENSD